MSSNPVNTLGDSQQATATVAFTDKAGNSAVVPVPPVWASSDPTILTVDQSGDATGMSALVKATGKEGTVTLSITASDATGKVLVVVSAQVQIVAEAAMSGTVTLGTPTEQ